MFPLMIAIAAQIGYEPLEHVALGDFVYVLTPPVVVADQAVVRASWSPDGKYVVCERRVIDYAQVLKGYLEEAQNPPQVEVSLVVWNAKTRKSTSLLSWKAIAGGEPEIDEPTWLHQSDVAYLPVTIGEGPGSGYLYRITPTVASLLGRFEEAPIVQASPVGPIGLLRFGLGATEEGPESKKEFRERVQFIGPNGLIGQPHVLETPTPFVEWAPDGRAVHVHRQRISKEQSDWYTLHLNGRLETGLRHSLSEAIRKWVDEAKPPFELINHEAKPGDSKKTIDMLFLVSSDSPKGALVSPNSDSFDASVSPNLDAVLYISEGIAFVRRLIKVSKAEYEDKIGDESRVEMLMAAKQCAAGLIMFAGDNDEHLPTNLEEIIPYVKNEALIARFVYTPPGKKLDEVEDPAATVIGYIEGKKGRAVAYADGHVKWIRN